MRTDHIEPMRTGGARLRAMKPQLQAAATIGTSFAEIEAVAQSLIKAAGGIPNFALVPGYQWATCIMKNDELCHGIPTTDKIIADGDIISIDFGMLFEGWHLDTSISFGVGSLAQADQAFLAVGEKALAKAISRVKAGASVHDLSSAMQKTVERAGFSAAHQLTGHGVGKELHMDPEIPCIARRSDKRVLLQEGQTIAVEIMYAKGDATVVRDADGWTERTIDGSLSAMFEETVLVTKTGYEILT